MGRFDDMCKKLNRAPEDECGRIIQNLTVLAHILEHDPKYKRHGATLYNAAESYSELFLQQYPVDNEVLKK